VETFKIVLYSVLRNAAILALLLVAFPPIRNLIAEWIGRSIQHRYDTKLEELRAANEKELNLRESTRPHVLPRIQDCLGP